MKKAVEKYAVDKWIRPFFCSLGFIYFAYQGFTKERIISPDDLMQVHGKFMDYTYNEVAGSRATVYQFVIWIDSYKGPFHITANHFEKFNYVDFVTTVRRGDSIHFSIPKHLSKNLNAGERVFVTSVKANQTSYLHMVDVLEIENSLMSLYSDFFISAIFLVVGLVVIIKSR